MSEVDDMVNATGLAHHTIGKFLFAEAFLDAAKRMVRTERQPYHYRVAAQLLYAIALEVGFKALWEIDNSGKKAKHTHDLTGIFAGLRSNRRETHRQWYDIIARQQGSSVSFESMLKANGEVVTKFKYGEYDGVTGGIVGGEAVNGVIMGGHGALISYSQFVVDHLTLAIEERFIKSGENQT